MFLRFLFCPDIPNALINPLIFIATSFSKSSIELFPVKFLYFCNNNFNDLIFDLYFLTVGFVSNITVLLSLSFFVVVAFGCAFILCLIDFNFDATLITASVIF